MERTELAALLRQALIKSSRLRLEVIRDEDVLTRDLGFDSFALLNVILELEDRLGVEIDPSHLARLREMDFGGLVSLVSEHISSSAAHPAP